MTREKLVQPASRLGTKNKNSGYSKMIEYSSNIQHKGCGLQNVQSLYGPLQKFDIFLHLP